jgi:hypothetical protein
MPTKQEITKALETAQRMSANDDDAEHLAKTLLYLARRVQDLERIREYAERYVRFGNPVEDHRDLLVALQKAREHALSGADDAEFGLGGGRDT